MSRIESHGVMLSVTDLPRRPGRRTRQPGLPVVMVHGLAASSAFWYAAGAPILSLMGRTVLYDLRGHGKSDVPDSGYGVASMARDLEALIEKLGLTRYHLVAHSFGGMIALTQAMRHPDQVASLTLVDVRIRPIQSKISIPVADIPPAVERQLADLGIDAGKLNQAGDGVDYLRTVARIEIEAGDRAAGLLAAVYRHPKLFRNRRNAERWIELCERVSLIADLAEEPSFTAADLAKLKVPMLILVGGQSNTLPSARELARLCPHAVFHEVPGVGHFFPMSKPRAFLRPTMRFLHLANQREWRQTLQGTARELPLTPANVQVSPLPQIEASPQIEPLRPLATPPPAEIRTADFATLRRASGAS